uniref:Peptidase C1A papain C-terminal domain-containing protein n=1 Tax=Chromera velia CCMP2878 TaxID=1169474 RepID=A0A0G4FBS2_9ALVE|eukprot:Cvel_16251.t1-p1 / transcript=Cvel_16251.t1 / gene=Cvel_16251 / organism=Chromera_velia_CCMP2878 / gene_product=hypothetical protein / transcript_product=hypothetical protein / location=Cvel_scaffold1243:29379-32471(-) / protein_length=389 / sequence_SO=supercontig / SO=protein_coding / is_pseudo=false
MRILLPVLFALCLTHALCEVLEEAGKGKGKPDKVRICYRDRLQDKDGEAVYKFHAIEPETVKPKVRISSGGKNADTWVQIEDTQALPRPPYVSKADAKRDFYKCHCWGFGCYYFQCGDLNKADSEVGYGIVKSKYSFGHKRRSFLGIGPTLDFHCSAIEGKYLYEPIDTKFAVWGPEDVYNAQCKGSVINNRVMPVVEVERKPNRKRLGLYKNKAGECHCWGFGCYYFQCGDLNKADSEVGYGIVKSKYSFGHKRRSFLGIGPTLDFHCSAIEGKYLYEPIDTKFAVWGPEDVYNAQCKGSVINNRVMPVVEVERKPNRKRLGLYKNKAGEVDKDPIIIPDPEHRYCSKDVSRLVGYAEAFATVNDSKLNRRVTEAQKEYIRALEKKNK